MQEDPEAWRTPKPEIAVFCSKCDRFMQYRGEYKHNSHVYRCNHCGNLIEIMHENLLRKEQPGTYGQLLTEQANFKQ
ncbi:MAG: hypothetical protein NWE94_05450 [Candidatus Bathyarchaeota archaeon]|nr:hypothetical protein [Candidatus Bathyarchaeota archaeon]